MGKGRNNPSYSTSLLNEAANNPILAEMIRNTDQGTSSVQQDLPNTLKRDREKKQMGDLWEETYGEFFNNFSSESIGNIPDDLSEYTRLGTRYNPYSPESSMDQRAENQSNWEQFSNAGKRFLGGTALEIAHTAGAVLDVADYVNSDLELGNAITQWANDRKKAMNEATPIYVGSQENIGTFDFGWWMENGSSLTASIAGFAISGGVIGKALSSVKWLDRLTRGYRQAKRGKSALSAATDAQIGAGSKLLSGQTIGNISKAQQASNALISATALNQAESISSATQVFDDVYKDGLSRGLSDQKAKEIAASAATYTVNVNRANILLNLTSAAKFLKTPDAIQSARRVTSWNLKNIHKFRDAEGRILKSVPRDLILEGGQEAVEELINVYSEGRGKNFAESLFDSDKEDIRMQNMKALFEPLNYSEMWRTAKTEEGIEAMILGAIGGIGQTGATAAINAIPGSDSILGRMWGERVAKLDEEGNKVYKERSKTYDRDTEYEIGEKIFNDITDNEGNVIARKGETVSMEMLAQHRDNLVHKKGEEVLDSEGQVIKEKSDELEYEKDGKYMSKNEAEKVRTAQYDTIYNKMKEVAQNAVNVKNRARNDAKNFAATEAVDMLLDPQTIQEKKEDYYDILARWQLNGTEEKIDFNSEEGSKLLSEEKDRLKNVGYKELMNIKNKAKSNLIQQQAWVAFSAGSKPSFEQIWKDVLNTSEEEAEKRGYVDDYKEQAQSVLNQIDYLYNFYREANAKYSPEKAKALYDLNAETLHLEKVDEQYKQMMQNIIDKNAALDEDSSEYMTTLEGIEKFEKLKADEEAELKPKLEQIKKLKSREEALAYDLSLDSRVTVDSDEINTDRDYINALAKKKKERYEELSKLRNEYNQLQDEVDTIRKKYANKRTEENITSRADIEAVVEIKRLIRENADEIARKNKEFIRIRDRKTDPSAKQIRISEDARQRRMFQLFAERAMSMQETGEFAVTFNPSLPDNPNRKFVKSILARLSKVVKEGGPGVKGKLDTAIKEYKNILNDNEREYFDANEKDIRSEIIEEINRMNLPESSQKMNQIEELSALGFTGELTRTSNPDVFEFTPNLTPLMYVDDAEVDYYTNQNFPGSTEKMYEVEEVSNGLYKVTPADPTATIRVTYKDLEALSIITAEQARVKDVIDAHVNITRSRAARLNALESLKGKTLIEASEAAEEAIRDLTPMSNMLMGLLGDEQEADMIKAEYKKVFGEDLDDDISPAIAEEMIRVKKMIDKISKSKYLQYGITQDALTYTGDLKPGEYINVTNQLRSLVDGWEALESDIADRENVAQTIANMGFEPKVVLSEYLTNSSLSESEIIHFIESMSEAVDALDEEADSQERFIAKATDALRAESVQQDLAFLKSVRNKLTDSIAALRSTLKEKARITTTSSKSVLTEAEKEKYDIIRRNMRTDYAPLIKVFGGAVPGNRSSIDEFVNMYEELDQIIKDLGDVNGVITAPNVQQYIQKFSNVLSNINALNSINMTLPELESMMNVALEEKEEALVELNDIVNKASTTQEEVDLLLNTIAENDTKISNLKRLESDVRLAETANNMIDDIKNAIKSLQESNNQDVTVRIGATKIEFAKRYNKFRDMASKLRDVRHMVGDYNSDLNYLSTLERKGTLDSISSLKELMDNNVDKREELREAIRQAGNALMRYESMRSQVLGTLQLKLADLASSKGVVSDLYLEVYQSSTTEDRQFFEPATTEEVMQMSYTSIKETRKKFQEYTQKLEDIAVDRDQYAEFIRTQMEHIDKAKDNIVILTELYGESESAVIMAEAEMSQLALQEMQKRVNDLSRAINLFEKHSNLLNNMESRITDVLTEENIRAMYDPEELQEWEQTGNIDDLPGDPAIRVMEFLDTIPAEEVESLSEAIQTDNNTLGDIARELNLERKRLNQEKESSDRIADVINDLERTISDAENEAITTGDDSQFTIDYIDNLRDRYDQLINLKNRYDNEFVKTINRIDRLVLHRNRTLENQKETIAQYVESLDDDIKEMNSVIKESSIVLQLLNEAYGDIDELIKSEQAATREEDKEEIKKRFSQQSINQKGVDSTGERPSSPENAVTQDGYDIDLEQKMFSRLYDEANTILKRKNVVTDAGAHVQYEKKYKDGAFVYIDKTDENGIPLFVKNDMMIRWKTAISRLASGRLKKDNGEVLELEDVSMRLVTTDHPSVTNLTAHSNNLNRNSIQNLDRRGIIINPDNGQLTIGNKSKFDRFIDNYIEPYEIPQEDLDRILELKNKEANKPFTVGEMDLLFRYDYNASGALTMRRKSDNVDERVNGVGSYMIMADQDGKPLKINLSTNRVTTKDLPGYIVTANTINSVGSAEKTQFRENFAELVSHQRGYPMILSFDELLDQLRKVEYAGKSDDEITIDFEKIDGRKVTYTLADIVKMNDNLTYTDPDNNGLKDAVREHLDQKLENFARYRNYILSKEKSGAMLLDKNFAISDGHPLESSKERTVNEVFSREDLDQIAVSTQIKAGKDPKDKIRGGIGEPISFVSNDGVKTPSPKVNTGRAVMLTKNKEWIPVRSRKLNKEEAELLLELIKVDFGTRVAELDTQFKVATNVVDEDGNKVDIPGQKLIRFKQTKGMSVNDYPMISKLTFFSGVKPDSPNRKPWDISVEKSKFKKNSSRNYLHYGIDNEVAIQELLRNEEEQKKFLEWAQNNLSLMINAKAAIENQSEPYYHPVGIEFDGDKQYTATVKKYDSYMDYLYEQEVLLTKSVSRSESEANGGMGELNVNKYVELSESLLEAQGAPVDSSSSDSGPTDTDPDPEPEDDVDTKELFDFLTGNIANISDKRLNEIPDNVPVKHTITQSINIGGSMLNAEFTFIGTKKSSNTHPITRDNDGTFLDNFHYIDIESTSAKLTMPDGTSLGEELDVEIKRIVTDLFMNETNGTVIDHKSPFFYPLLASRSSDLDLNYTDLFVPEKLDAAKASDIKEAMAKRFAISFGVPKGTPITISNVSSRLVSNPDYTAYYGDINTLAHATFRKIVDDTRPKLNNLDSLEKEKRREELDKVIESFKLTKQLADQIKANISQKEIDTLDADLRKEVMEKTSNLYAVVSEIEEMIKEAEKRMKAPKAAPKKSPKQRARDKYINELADLMKSVSNYKIFPDFIQVGDLKIYGSDFGTTPDTQTAAGEPKPLPQFSIKSENTTLEELKSLLNNNFDKLAPNIEKIVRDTFGSADVKIESKPEPKKTTTTVGAFSNSLKMSPEKKAYLNNIKEDWKEMVLIDDPNFKGFAWYSAKSDGTDSIIIGKEFITLPEKGVDPADVIIHEITHAATSRRIKEYADKIRNNESVPGYISEAFDILNEVRSELINDAIVNNTMDSKLVYDLIGIKDIDEIIQKVVNDLNVLRSKDADRNLTFDDFMQSLSTYVNDDKVLQNARENVKEIVASTFDGTNLAKRMNNIEVEGKGNLLKNVFVNFIRSLFNLDVKANSLLAKALDASVRFLDKDEQSFDSESPIEPTRDEDDDIMDIPGLEGIDGYYPPNDKTGFNVLDSLGDDKARIAKSLKNLMSMTPQEKHDFTDDLLSKLGYTLDDADYLGIKTSLALSGEVDADVLSDNDAIKSFVLEEVSDFLIEIEMGNKPTESSIFKYNKFKNIKKDLSDLVDTINQNEIKSKIMSQIVLQQQNQEALDALNTLTIGLEGQSVDPNEKILLYSGISYNLFKSILETPKLATAETIPLSELDKLYIGAIDKALKTMKQNADTVLENQERNKENGNDVDELMVQKAERALEVRDALSELLLTKSKTSRELLRKIIVNHYESVMIPFGYSQITSTEDDVDTPENILSTIPDYVQTYKVNPMLMMINLAKIMISAIDKRKVSSTKLSNENLEQSKAILNSLKSMRDEFALYNNSDNNQKKGAFDKKSRMYLAQVGKVFKVPSATELVNNSGPYTDKEKKIVRDILSVSVPEYEQRVSSKQIVKTSPDQNDFFLHTLEDYGRVWNFIARQTSNTPPDVQLMLDKINNLISSERRKPKNRGIHGIDSLQGFMQRFNDFSDPVNVAITSSLLQSLNKFEMFHTIVIADNRGNIYETVANTDRKMAAVRAQWMNNISEQVSRFNNVMQRTDDAGSLINTLYISSVNKILNGQANNKGDSEDRRALDALAKLGITFNDENAAVATYYETHSESLKSFVQNMLSYMTDTDAKGKKNKGILGKDAKLLFKSSSDAISGRIATLLKIELANDTDIVTNQFMNSNGEVVYALQEYHTLSLLFTKMNSYANKGNLMDAEMPYVNSVYNKRSKLKSQIKSGVTWNPTVVNGMRVNRSSETGTDTSKLSVADHLAVRIQSALSGTYLIPRAADRTVHSAAKRSDGRPLFESEQEAYETFIGYLEDELATMSRYVNDPEYSKINNSERAKKFRFFGEILKNDPELATILQGLFVEYSDGFYLENNSLKDYDKANGTDYYSRAYNAVHNYFEGKVSDYYEYLLDEGVIERTPKVRGAKGRFVDSAYIDDERKNSIPVALGISKDTYLEYSKNGALNKEQTIRKILKDFLLNQTGFYIEFTKNFSGDPAFFKTEDDFFKRMSMINSTRKLSMVGLTYDNAFNKHNGAEITYEETDQSSGLTTTKKIVADADLMQRYIKSKMPTSELAEELQIPNITSIKLQSGFRLDGRRHNSSFSSITFNDVELPSVYAEDNVVETKVKRDGTITYVVEEDGKKKEVESDDKSVSLYRKIFTEYLVDQGFTDSTLIAVKVKSMLSPYQKINEADGQSYITLDEYRSLLMRSGDWTPEHERVFIKMLRDEYISVDEMTYFQPLKTQYNGPMDMRDETVKNAYVPTGYKHSMIPLIPSVIKGTNLEKMNDWMVKHKVGVANYASANKFGTKKDDEGKINNFYTEDGNNLTVDTTKWNPDLIQDTFFEFFSIQVDNKPKLKDKVTSGSQKRKLVLSNVFAFGENPNAKLKEVAEEYVNLQNNMIQQELDALMEQLQVTVNKKGQYTIGNYKKLIELLLDHAKTREADENVITAIKMIDAAIQRPETMRRTNGLFIEEMSSRSSIESVLMALIRSRAINEKRKGESYVQSGNTGFEKSRIKGSQELKYYRINVKTGNMIPAQLDIPLRKEMIPALKSMYPKHKNSPSELLDAFNKDIAKLHDKMTKVREDASSTEELTEDEENLRKLITVIGFRIPTQQLGSIGIFEVRRFLPMEVGNSAHVPPEIVAQMGSDMDFDKLVVEYPNFISSEKGMTYLDSENVDYTSEYFAYLGKKLSGNARLKRKVFKKVARDWSKELKEDSKLMEISDYVNDLYVQVRNEIRKEDDMSFVDDLEMMAGLVAKKAAPFVKATWGLDEKFSEELIYNVISERGMSLKNVNAALGEQGLIEAMTMDEIISYMSNNKFEDYKNFQDSPIYKALVSFKEVLSFDEFSAKLQDKAQANDYISKRYMENRMIRLQEQLLLDKSRSAILLSPVIEAALIGKEKEDPGIVWKIRFLTDQSPEAMKDKEALSKDVRQKRFDGYFKNTREREKYVEKELNKLVDKYTKWYSEQQRNRSYAVIMDPKTNIDKSQYFLVGKDLIGIVARHITSHTLTQVSSAAVNEPLFISETDNGSVTLVDNSNVLFNINFVNSDGSPFKYKRSDIMYYMSNPSKYVEKDASGRFSRLVDNNGNTVLMKGQKIYPALGGINTTSGSDILQTLSTFLNAYVDVAKDPYIFDMNAGKETVDTFLYLLRLGADVNEVSLMMNQPAVLDYVKAKSKYSSNFRKSYNLVPGKTAIAASVMSKYDPVNYVPLLTVDEFYQERTEQEELEFKEHMERIGYKKKNYVDYNEYFDKYKNWADKNVKMLWKRKDRSHKYVLRNQFKEEYRNEDLRESLASRNVKIGWSYNDDVANYRYVYPSEYQAELMKTGDYNPVIQKQALDMFLEYQRQAGILREVMDATSHDTYGTGKSYIETEQYLIQTEETHNSENILRSRDMIDKSIVKGFDSTVQTFVKLVNPLYAMKGEDALSVFYDQFVQSIIKYNTQAKKQAEALNHYDRELMNFILHTDFGDGMFVDKDYVFNNLINGTENSRYLHPVTGTPISLIDFVRLVNGYTTTGSEPEYIRKLRNNAFFKKLNVIGDSNVNEAINEGRSSATTDSNLALSFIVVNRTKNEKDALINAFRELKIIDRALYNDLLLLGLAQHGVSGGADSFSSFIPPEDITKIKVKQLNNLFSLSEQVQDIFIDEFAAQATSSYRSIRHLETAPSTRQDPTLDERTRYVPFINRSPATAPLEVVRYKVNSDGTSLIEIWAGKVRNGQGTSYISKRTVLGSRNWIGYKLKVDSDFVQKAISRKAEQKLNLKVRKSSTLPRVFNFLRDSNERLRLTELRDITTLMTATDVENSGLSTDGNIAYEQSGYLYSVETVDEVLAPTNEAEVSEILNKMNIESVDQLEDERLKSFLQMEGDPTAQLVRIRPISHKKQLAALQKKKGLEIIPNNASNIKSLSEFIANTDGLKISLVDIDLKKGIDNFQSVFDDIISGKTDEEIPYSDLTSQSVAKYYKLKDFVQNLYDRNVPIAFDENNGRAIVNLEEYLKNNYNYLPEALSTEASESFPDLDNPYYVSESNPLAPVTDDGFDQIRENNPYASFDESNFESLMLEEKRLIDTLENVRDLQQNEESIPEVVVLKSLKNSITKESAEAETGGKVGKDISKYYISSKGSTVKEVADDIVSANPIVAAKYSGREVRSLINDFLKKGYRENLEQLVPSMAPIMRELSDIQQQLAMYKDEIDDAKDKNFDCDK